VTLYEAARGSHILGLAPECGHMPGSAIVNDGHDTSEEVSTRG
jgi:hypothetical protein